MNEEIKKLRLSLNKSQEDFAQLIGVSVDSVRKWEQGKRNPSRMAYEKIGMLVKKLKKEKNSGRQAE